MAVDGEIDFVRGGDDCSGVVEELELWQRLGRRDGRGDEDRMAQKKGESAMARWRREVQSEQKKNRGQQGAKKKKD